jgi:hypothetical protein
MDGDAHCICAKVDQFMRLCDALEAGLVQRRRLAAVLAWGWSQGGAKFD